MIFIILKEAVEQIMHLDLYKDLYTRLTLVPSILACKSSTFHLKLLYLFLMHIHVHKLQHTYFSSDAFKKYLP